MRTVSRFALFLVCTAVLSAQAEDDYSKEAPLPLKKVSLFSSGVGFFSHSGVVSGNISTHLSFTRSALNDALKSLMIHDAESGSPQITYLSDTTLVRTLQSLKIDLSGNPGLQDILASLKGAEIIAHVNTSIPLSEEQARYEDIRGRIVTVDKTGPAALPNRVSGTISLSTDRGLRTIELRRLISLSFSDENVHSDLVRALDLINAARGEHTREINVTLTGKRRREVTISYVIPTPVWKISYRLDLNYNAPVLQSWAIIDNDGDIDWNGVEVSLVSGMPVSFVQELYPPYYTNRPTLPLAGAGFAEARTHDSGWNDMQLKPETQMYSNRDTDSSQAPRSKAAESNALAARIPAPEEPAYSGGSIGASYARQAGDQFEFTLKKPVTLARQQSAMLPIFDGSIKARKILVFSGQRALNGSIIHPSISVELTNSTGIKLPAGSVTVFEGGIYAGDALLDFLNTGEKRIISYGDDLSVSGSVKTNMTRKISTARISKGLIVMERKLLWSRTYTIRNTASEAKRLVIEHPVTPNTTLTLPELYTEKTQSLYRFEMDLRGNQILTFDVAEERPLSEQITLASLSGATLLLYAENGEIPDEIRAVFRNALLYKNESVEAEKTIATLEKLRAFKIAEQERIRANLTAAGGGTPEGQNYLSLLTGLDKEISEITAGIEAAQTKADEARKKYADYIAELELR
ncbi:MAG: DUF4139 domain-containing protein [Spirochaetaceae bacterium]|jgi:hypothetical protein|nr:DUF4139 domain-containing protein [Spirochaetaceae bacterium]